MVIDWCSSIIQSFDWNTHSWILLADCPSLGSNAKQVLQLSISTGPLLSPLQGLINVTSCEMAASRHNTPNVLGGMQKKRPVFIVFYYEGVRTPPPLHSPVGK